jgi:UDP-N-acetylglucosamine 2-epimerase
MSILVTYGTRPEFIKVKPLIIEMVKQNITFKTLFTGQHKDLVEEGADFNLEMIDHEGNRLDSIMKNCLSIPEEWFNGITHLLVQGDTTSVAGLALTAMHRKIKIIHLEAGLRTYDRENPFPEENNRRIVSAIADIHLCPTEQNYHTLISEQVIGRKEIVGNTGLDNLKPLKEKATYSDLILVTLHRRENHDNMDKWFAKINDIAQLFPQFRFVIPLHPNPNVQKHRHLLTKVEVIEPLPHNELMELLITARIVITDSGGLQEECSFFNKKCLVLRKETERTETIGMTSFMVDKPTDLYSVLSKHIDNYKVDFLCPYGDGNASKKIVNILKSL